MASFVKREFADAKENLDHRDFNNITNIHQQQLPHQPNLQQTINPIDAMLNSISPAEENEQQTFKEERR